MTLSRPPVSNQAGLHERLDEVVRRHFDHPSKTPVPDHATEVFDQLSELRRRDPRPLVLDSGCGTGDSSRALARLLPDHLVLGIDKSAHRLAKRRDGALPDNLHLIRGDLMHLYPLMARAGWRLARHTIFYPNPWPKAAHLQRRWHGSAAFPAMLALGGLMELRTNWRLYAEEFAASLSLAGHDAPVSAVPEGEPISLFERKYRAAGHGLWQVSLDLGATDAPGSAE